MPNRSGFSDECGVFGVCDSEDAANLAYLGLYALQHRGQESAGIASLDEGRIRVEREMGYVADVFDEARLSRLPGRTAIGHVRYSTAGASLLENAQPIVFATGRGPLALAHNGNLVNAREIRAVLESKGRALHDDLGLGGHPPPRGPLAGARRCPAPSPRRLLEVRGAYSIVILSREGIFAARDPNGIRPLSLGIREGSPVVASETCAFDLIGAKFERDVEAGEIVKLSREGFTSHRFAFPLSTPCVFEHVYFARPDSMVFGRSVAASRQGFGRRLAREHPAQADVVVAVPDSGMYPALGYAEESKHPVRPRPRAQPLRRTDVHRAQAGHPPLRRQGQAQPGARGRRGQAHRSRGRFDRARDDLPQDRPDAPRGRGDARSTCACPLRRRSTPATTASTRRPRTS